MGDVRLGEPWSMSQTIRNDIVYAVSTWVLRTALGVPAGGRRAIGRWVGWLAGAGLVGASRVATRRLEDAYRGNPPVNAREVFMTMGEDLADMVSLFEPATRARMPLDPESRALVEKALGLGKGAVVGTAHWGLLEWMAASVAEQGFRVWTVARESYDPRFTALYERLRAPRQVHTAYRGQPGAHKALVRALRGGCLVGFPMDWAGRGMATVRCDFLGREVEVPAGPARLALKLRAPVVVASPWKNKTGEWQIRMDLVQMAAEGDLEGLTRRIVKSLETRILVMPAHWPWMHGSRN